MGKAKKGSASCRWCPEDADTPVMKHPLRCAARVQASRALEKGTRVLVYGNRKQPTQAWDATGKLYPRAILACFRVLDVDWSVYGGLDDFEEPTPPEPHVPGCRCADCFDPKGAEERRRKAREEYEDMKWQFDLLARAREGDSVAAEELMARRRGREYEEWNVLEAEAP